MVWPCHLLGSLYCQDYLSLVTTNKAKEGSFKDHMDVDCGEGYVVDRKDLEQNSNPGKRLAAVEGSHCCPIRLLV